MAKLKHWVNGSSIVEAITASLIFITVFTISIATIANSIKLKVPCRNFIELDKYSRELLKMYLEDYHPCGEYIHEMGSGKAKVFIAPFREDLQIFKLDLEIFGDKDGRILKQTHLICYEQEDVA